MCSCTVNPVFRQRRPKDPPLAGIYLWHDKYQISSFKKEE